MLIRLLFCNKSDSTINCLGTLTLWRCKVFSSAMLKLFQEVELLDVALEEFVNVGFATGQTGFNFLDL